MAGAFQVPGFQADAFQTVTTVQVGASLAGSWRLRTATGASRPLTWRIVNAIGAPLPTAWRIGAGAPVLPVGGRLQYLRVPRPAKRLPSTPLVAQRVGVGLVMAWQIINLDGRFYGDNYFVLIREIDADLAELLELAESRT